MESPSLSNMAKIELHGRFLFQQQRLLRVVLVPKGEYKRLANSPWRFVHIC